MDRFIAITFNYTILEIRAWHGFVSFARGQCKFKFFCPASVEKLLPHNGFTEMLPFELHADREKDKCLRKFDDSQEMKRDVDSRILCHSHSNTHSEESEWGKYRMAGGVGAHTDDFAFVKGERQ